MDDLTLPADGPGGAHFEAGRAAWTLLANGMAHGVTSRPSCGWTLICQALFLLRIIAGSSSSMARSPTQCIDRFGGGNAELMIPPDRLPEKAAQAFQVNHHAAVPALLAPRFPSVLSFHYHDRAQARHLSSQACPAHRLYHGVHILVCLRSFFSQPGHRPGLHANAVGFQFALECGTA